MMDRKLERWLDMKAEKDMLKAVNGTDPYVIEIDHGIFDEYRDGDDSMEEYFSDTISEIWN